MAYLIKMTARAERDFIVLVLYRILEKEKLVQVLHIRHGARRSFKPADLS